MSFERWFVAVAALAPLVWIAWAWWRGRQRAALTLKALAVAAILLAVSEPRISVWETKMAVAVLADTSVSLPPEDLKRASEIVTRIEQSRGRHRVQVFPFARAPRPADVSERPRGWALKHTAGEAGQSTDLEAAVREAIASMPAGMVPRIVLISDGKENRGSVARAVWQAQQLGMPIDTHVLPGRPRPGLRLEAVTMPSVAFTGERFPLDITLVSPAKSSALVEISAGGKLLGSSSVTLEAGTSQVRVHTSVATVGAIELTGIIRAPGLGEARFSEALTLRKPRMLLVSQDPPGTESHLAQTLEAGHFDMDRAASVTQANLPQYQVVALNNHDLEAIPAARKADLEAYVKQGGGLLVIGGERNVYVEHKAAEDALDRVLPAKLAPPRSPEGTCLVLIVDKSSSMEGRKMELARLAAIGVIENLRPIDIIGVLIFDNSFHWAVPIRRAEDRTQIKRLVAGITPDGGTQIAPALAESYRRILPVQATFKHIVLLTDGISEEGDSMSLAKEAAAQRVTISTVGLGQDVNRAYLEKVAGYARGKAYFLTDPSGLEQILLRDVMEHTGSTAVEKPIHAMVVKQTEILNGTGIETAPPLKGYVRFTAKPTADTILQVDKKDPLLARWQYGLGRAAVFTSDAKSRWAEQWVSWKGFDRFWVNVFRDLLPHTQAGEVKVDFDSANGELVIDYRLAADVEEPPETPAIYIFGPEKLQKSVEVRKIARGAFQGRVPIGSAQGLFHIRPLEESRIFPEVGYYRQRDELIEHGNDELLMRQIAEFTGGRFRPEPAQVFDSSGRSVAGVMQLWPGLLALALALNIAELVLRKWVGLLEFFSRRKAAAEPA